MASSRPARTPTNPRPEVPRPENPLLRLEVGVGHDDTKISCAVVKRIDDFFPSPFLHLAKHG